MSREMKHPRITISGHDDGLAIEFLVPGSKFGAVEIVFSETETETLIDDLCTAAAFMVGEATQ